MHGDVVGILPDGLEVALTHSELGSLFLSEDRIEGDDLHAEGNHAPGYLATDAPEAKNAEYLAVELVAGVEFTIPASLLHRLTCLHDVAGQSRDNGACQLAGAYAIASRGTETCIL